MSPVIYYDDYHCLLLLARDLRRAFLSLLGSVVLSTELRDILSLLVGVPEGKSSAEPRGQSSSSQWEDT